MSDAYDYKVSNPVFRYVVLIDGTAVAAFLDCTLPSIKWEMQSVREGGLNTYVHQLPGHRGEMNITLRNGVGLKDTMEKWYMDAMDESFTRKSITIELHNNASEKVATWTVEDCIPVSWTGPQLSSSDSSIAIQTFELACGNLTHELPQSIPVSMPVSPHPRRNTSGSLVPQTTIGQDNMDEFYDGPPNREEGVLETAQPGVDFPLNPNDVEFDVEDIDVPDIDVQIEGIAPTGFLDDDDIIIEN